MTGGIAVVGAVPPEAEGNGPRTQAALLEGLHAAGVTAWSVVLGDDAALADAIDRADVVTLVDPRPVHAELARVARLSDARRLALIPTGYAFCEIASRTCERCPLAKICPASDRVAVYRALAARADLIVYASDLQRTASEAYVGEHPETTRVLPPPNVPTLAASAASTRDPGAVGCLGLASSASVYRSASSSTRDPGAVGCLGLASSASVYRSASLSTRDPGAVGCLGLASSASVYRSASLSGDAVAFAGGDPVEWQNLIAWAAAHPDRALALYGVPPQPVSLPATVDIRSPIGTRAQLDVIAGARTLVVLPAHPLPYGIAAAAARRAGKDVVTNDRVGLVATGQSATELDAALHRAAADHAAALIELARGPIRQRRAAPPLGRVLLYVHHVGLGDSINLSALARTLIDARADVTYAVPAAHHALLADQLPGGRVTVADELDPLRARSDHDIIVEVTILPGDAYAGDISDERWLQLALDRQPSGLTPMHEQFLALFARAGHPLVPCRPEIALTSDELAAARAIYRDAGIDLDRELVVAVHPGAGNPGKRWAAARFGELVQRLRTRGARLALVGGDSERELVANVAAAGVDVIRVGTPLRDVGAVLAAATLAVANDSGLMHLASAVGTPTLGIFGPTSERLWGPTHPYAASVRARSAEPGAALSALTADDVERALIELGRKVAAEPPLSRSLRIVPSPRVFRSARGDTVEWRGRAVVTIHGADEPIAAVVNACRAEPTWAELSAAHEPELLSALVAAEVIVPRWAVGALS